MNCSVFRLLNGFLYISRWIVWFFRLFLADKNVKRVSYLPYFTTSSVSLPGKLALKFKLQLWNVPLETEPWTIFCGTNKNSKEEFFQCFDKEAVYSTPLTFTRHRSGSRDWRIHENLVVDTTTTKSNRVCMRPTLFRDWVANQRARKALFTGSVYTVLNDIILIS